MFRLTRRALVAGAAVVVLAPAAGRAQAWPSKQIRLVVPYPAGGPTDILARTIAQHLSESLRQQVVVDNKPGASGALGSDIVAKAAPDGYTLVMGNNATHATNQSLYPNFPYDAAKDFAPITLVAGVTHVLVVHPDLPAKTVQEFVAWAKQNPGKINVASTGSGSASHLTLELFKGALNLDMTHVPYKGSAPAVQDLLGGQVQASFQTLPSVLPQIKADKLRALATTGRTRSASLPDLPTIAETAIPGFHSDAWFALFAPAGTPQDIVEKINDEVGDVLARPDVKLAAEKQGFSVEVSKTAELGDFVKAEIVKWAEVVKKSGAKVD
jgi:tripartite-type tricarboxylate transporter receptor subunit TctC